MHLPKQLSPIPRRAPQQLRLAAGVEGQVGTHVVHLPAQHRPGVLAPAAGHPLQHRRRDAEVGRRGPAGQVSQVGVARGGQARPVERGVARFEDDLAGGLGWPGAVGGRRGEGGGAGLSGLEAGRDRGRTWTALGEGCEGWWTGGRGHKG